MRYLYVCLFLFLAADTVGAQPAGDPPWPWIKERPKGYVHFGFDPNVESVVKDRLKLERDLGSLKDLVKQILANPDQYPLDPAKLKDARLDNPELHKAVQNWLAQDPNLKEAMETWIKKQPADKKADDVKKLQQNLKTILDQAVKPNANTDVQPEKSWPKPEVPDQPKIDPLAKATQRAMKNAEKTEFGKWLSESPAWKQAFEDLQASMTNPDGSPWEMGDWQKTLGLDEQKAWRFGEDTLKRLQDVPRPNFNRVRWNRILPGVDTLPLPNLGAPAMPGFGGQSLPSLGTAASWGLLIVVTLLFAWQMLRWTSRTRAPDDERAKLGPWPVLPDAVSTRAELVLAFDYLALHSLGMRATSWNHHAVARRWSEQSPALTPMAQALASLYESCRYTEGNNDLATPARDQARQALKQLAEALQ